MTLWVLGGDARNHWAAEYLRRQGFETEAHGVPEMKDSPLPDQMQYVILPFPSLSGEKLRGNSNIDIGEVIKRSGPFTRIFGGLISSRAADFAGAQVYDLYGTEPLTTCNAVPTAEGAVALAMELSPITIHGSRCLVAGFGRCGKVLARTLKALGAQVTAGLRNPKDEALARVLSMDTDRTGVWAKGLSSYDFIFNTVPAPVFSAEQLAELSPECIFIELASRPGGVAAADIPSVNYHFAPGLPGRAAPKTAGILYARSILRILEKECFH